MELKQNNERRNSDRIIKKRTDDPCTGGGLRKPGWMPGFSWNMSQEKSRAYYFAYGEESVTESAAERYLELISRRAGHIPLQHLTHQAFFYGA